MSPGVPREKALVLAILAIAALLRLVHPGADVPLAYEATDAPVQDAFWYLEHAAARAEGVEPDDTAGRYEPRPWVAVARLWFELVGPSVATAGLLGGLVSLLTVALVWRLARSALGPRAGLACAAALAVCPPVVLLGRTTLIYGPVALALVVAAALWLRAGEQRGARRHLLELGAWGLALGCFLAVRPPAAALCGGLACATLVRAERPARAAATVVAGLAGACLVLWAVDPAGVATDTRERLGRYVTRLGASTGAATGPVVPGEAPDEAPAVSLARRALRLGGAPLDGAGSGWLPLAPGCTLLGALGLLLAAVRRRELRPRARELLALAAGWGLAFAAAAVVIDYRPLRYFQVVGPPLALLAGFTAEALGRPGRRTRLDPPTAAFVAAWGVVVGPHVAELVLGRPLPIGALASCAVAGGALALGAVRLAGGGALPRTAVAGVIVAALGADLVRLELALAAPNRDALIANRLAGELLGPRARVVGPLAPLLCVGHGLERRLAPWIDLSPPRLAETLARLRGATHVALGLEHGRASDFGRRVRAGGLELELVAVLSVRRGSWPGLIYRLAGDVPYERSPYERGEPVTDPVLLFARVQALGLEGRVEAADAAIDQALRADPGLSALEGELRAAARRRLLDGP